ncbi:hypothetical protein A5320_04630 [Rheinheimera sp. SA_1]|uniref:porin family protein n=1 Tax=Rheinheimera sp. SA_1 TaxID=1827365 RepID=UPI00080169B0|nr:porin family protein [Rheinheimera sp. SA_1]OBP16678.1 hypothetical protein A5320_04630 [Rheinheimera sp. SA_1]
MKIITALLMLAAASPVLAFEFTMPDNIYLGGSYSTQQYANSNNGRNLQTLGMTLGYRLNDYLSFESRLNRGVSGYSTRYELPGSTIGDYREQLGWQSMLAVKGTYPLVGNLSVYGLLGYSHSKLEVDLLSSYRDPQNGGITHFPSSLTSSDSGALYGLGLKLQTGKNMDIYLDYQKLPDFAPNHPVSFSWKAITFGANYYF